MWHEHKKDHTETADLITETADKWLTGGTLEKELNHMLDRTEQDTEIFHHAIHKGVI